MRIIAGELRGRTVLAPNGLQTRPITDRAKQSLFDILVPQIPGARVYDCFAGTGSLGLECLSRGAEHVTFFERDRPAITLLRKNIEALCVTSRSTLITEDLFGWFAPWEGEAPAEPAVTEGKRLGRSLALPQPGINLVFLDPPYRYLRDQPAALCRVAQTIARDHLAEEGIVLFRHDLQDQLELPPLHRYDQRTYGAMIIEFLRQA